MSDWYIFLSQLNSLLNGPLSALSGEAGIPVLSALLLGVIGATAPCQLSANLAALAYVSQQGGDLRRTTGSIGAYILGKVLVYSLIGLIVLLFGLAIVSGSSVGFFALVRKAMGPLLILAGLSMAGVIRLPLSLGDGLSTRIARSAKRRGSRGAFVLGAGFSLAFCPTLFLLFFTMLLPMSMRTPGGFIFPGIFAVGTAMPLLIIGPLVSLGLMNSFGLAGKARKLDRILRVVTGVVFALVGINEIVNYWLA